MRLEAMPNGPAKTPNNDARPARDDLIRRIARLAYLVDQDAPEIILRAERRLVDEALSALTAAEKWDVWSVTQESGAVWDLDPAVVDRPDSTLSFAALPETHAAASRYACQSI